MTIQPEIRYVAGFAIVNQQMYDEMLRDEDAWLNALTDPNYTFPEDWDEKTTLND